jgi:bacterial/archaeal transporter family protein
MFQAGEGRVLSSVSRRSLIYLTLAGLATGVSSLAYLRALQLGPASRVAPIDKLSLPLTVLLAALFLGETVGWRVWVGVLLMTARCAA